MGGILEISVQIGRIVLKHKSFAGTTICTQRAVLNRSTMLKSGVVDAARRLNGILPGDDRKSDIALDCRSMLSKLVRDLLPDLET